MKRTRRKKKSARSSRFSLNNPFGKGKKQTASGKRKPAAEEYDEDEEEDEPQGRRQSRHSNVIHDSRMDPRAAQEAQYTHCERIVNVRQIEECREIIKYLLRGESVLLNLENIDPKDCGRVVDLLSGAAFALPGQDAEGGASCPTCLRRRMSRSSRKTYTRQAACAIGKPTWTKTDAHLNLQRALPVKKASRATHVFWIPFRKRKLGRSPVTAVLSSLHGAVISRPNTKSAVFCRRGEEALRVNFPLVTLHSRYSSKFCSLSHRDLLGSFMALGLTRDSIGDIIIVDSDIYLFVVAQTADFIAQSMNSAGKVPLRFEPIDGEIQIPEPKGICFHDTLSSMRLDAVLAWPIGFPEARQAS